MNITTQLYLLCYFFYNFRTLQNINLSSPCIPKSVLMLLIFKNVNHALRNYPQSTTEHTVVLFKLNFNMAAINM